MGITSQRIQSKRIKSKCIAAGALVGMLVGGCALGPDFNAPDAPKVGQYSSALENPSENRTADGPELKQGEHVPEQWWRVYGSKELNELISSFSSLEPYTRHHCSGTCSPCFSSGPSAVRFSDGFSNALLYCPTFGASGALKSGPRAQPPTSMPTSAPAAIHLDLIRLD